MIQCLSIEDIGLNELIWNVAQQISDVLPPDSHERHWLEGWLADRETIQRENRGNPRKSSSRDAVLMQNDSILYRTYAFPLKVPLDKGDLGG